MSVYGILLMIHIIVGGFCLLSGATNFLVKKEKGYHTRNGEWYHIGYLIILGIRKIVWKEG